MSPSDRFDTEANIARFAGMLYNETDPAMRARLQCLLVAEINQLALRRQLEMVDRHIAEASTRIEKQTRKILELHACGNDANQLYHILANSIAVLEVFKALRASLSDSLDTPESSDPMDSRISASNPPCFQL